MLGTTAADTTSKQIADSRTYTVWSSIDWAVPFSFDKFVRQDDAADEAYEVYGVYEVYEAFLGLRQACTRAWW